MIAWITPMVVVIAVALYVRASPLIESESLWAIVSGADWKPSEGQLRLRPDYWAEVGGMDGFFMARLQKV